MCPIVLGQTHIAYLKKCYIPSYPLKKKNVKTVPSLYHSIQKKIAGNGWLSHNPMMERLATAGRSEHLALDRRLWSYCHRWGQRPALNMEPLRIHWELRWSTSGKHTSCTWWFENESCWLVLNLFGVAPNGWISAEQVCSANGPHPCYGFEVFGLELKLPKVCPDGTCTGCPVFKSCWYCFHKILRFPDRMQASAKPPNNTWQRACRLARWQRTAFLRTCVFWSSKQCPPSLDIPSGTMTYGKWIKIAHV